ncbi:anthranilate phosphoribosyltransferase [Methylobacillus flagellatus]|uniref:Anthranilate phosphoribosyltransferase n=1 Tax=Methylobacillus flagellatus (strain ATCC 51484 / DSM 6875 / VKM B-1610 / KT) TaxID=265072 RepID=TRPD_METFK|nr:anthranilate phosphoribosyltransferase [Methylobacillus flagellatus]Q1GYF5.1 RecName: Full=Anthranilate phosphoribosyltransferase [Methylobacillus flagellatus KT]ABE50732.1 anthranilate phosphoribosyltransferase [Methylobacillus flagellatus KT]
MSMTPKLALQRLIDHTDFTHEEMLDVMQQIMGGAFTTVQIAGFLAGLRVKGETVTEIAAAAQVMRALSSKVEVEDSSYLVDTCGTGGAPTKAFNVSTASAFVAAGAGARIAKHGGRAASSKSGSADVLEALGVNIGLTPEQVARCVNEAGIGFMFAPNHHAAMKYAAPVRRELGVRTMFNLLGPMTNPAGAKRQVMGVFDRDLVSLLAHTLKKLGSEHVMVVHSADGMDEISFSADTYVAELKHGEVNEYTLNPAQFDMPLHEIDSIHVENAQQSSEIILGVLSGARGPARDIVLLNAGAAIYVSGIAGDLQDGIAQAAHSLDSGAALHKLQQLKALSQAA